MNVMTFFNQAEIKSQLYVQYVTLDPPLMTGWSLYILRKGLILAVSSSLQQTNLLRNVWSDISNLYFISSVSQAAGNVLTYVLVLYNIR